MKIKSFRVYMYRSIVDSQKVGIEPLTVLLGKNESGKTSLLRAIYKVNPLNGEKLDIKVEWPRGKRKEAKGSQDVCFVEIELTDDEYIDLCKATDEESIEIGRLEVARDYNDYFGVYNNNRLGILDSDALITAYLEQTVSPYKEINKGAVKKNIDAIIDIYLEDGSNFEAKVLKSIEDMKSLKDTVASTTAYSDLLEDLSITITGVSGIHSKVEKAKAYIKSIMPKFIYIDEYSVFRGRANLKEVSSRQSSKSLTPADNTLITIMELAGLDLKEETDKIGTVDASQRQFDLEDAGNKLSELIAKRWQQRKFKIEFRADGDEFLTYIRDDIDGSLIDLEERSKGFQWFLSFDLTFMRETKGRYENCILLLDEPGLYLHPDAQRDMLKRLEEYSSLNTIVYTTHLPFMIDLTHPERIRVMNEDKAGSYVTEDLTSGDRESKLVLQSALGMSGLTNYLVAERNLIVEGSHDSWIIAGMSNMLKRIGRTGLYDDVFITPAGGAHQSVGMATFMIGRKLQTVVLLDSDKSGNDAKDSLEKNWLIRFSEKKADVIQIADILDRVGEFEIEDLIPRSIYLDAVHKRYASDLKERGVKTITLQNTDGPILNGIESLFKQKKVKFNKGSVALVIRELLNSINDDSQPEIIAMSEATIKKINDAFDKMA